MPFDPVALANETPDSAAFERAVLDHLGRDIGFDAAFFAVLGERPSAANIDAAALEAGLAREDYARELAPTKEAARARRGVAVDTEVLCERRVRSLGYHRAFAAPIGGRHSLLGLLAVRGVPLGALMLGRCGSTFTGEQRARLEALLPALAVARASFRLPWPGAALPSAPGGALLRLEGWARGERILERVASGGVDIVVRDRAGYREMVAEDAEGRLVWTRAGLDEPERSGWFYVDLLHLAAARAADQRRFLFIGSGGGVAVRQFARVYPGAALDLVESDPRVIALAERWFALDAVPNLAVTVGDGAAFLRRAPDRTWDAVVVDAYDGAALPAPLASRAFFDDVRRALRPGGGFAFNAIGALGGESDVSRIERAARAARFEVRLVPVLDPGEAYAPDATRNVVLVGRRR